MSYRLRKNSRSYFCLPRRPAVPGLTTVTRDLTRRQRLDLLLRMDREVNQRVRLDLTVWNDHPENKFENNLLKTNVYGMKKSPYSDWEGSFEGKRYFQGKLPNHYEWEENGVQVYLEKFEGGVPFFKIIYDKYDEERDLMLKLISWYYSGRPGRKLRAYVECFDDQQLVVAEVSKGDFRRGRIQNTPRNGPIITDFDTGLSFSALDDKVYPIDEQFLSIPYRVFRSLITNRLKIIDANQIDKYWALFKGSATLADVQTVLPTGLENEEGVCLTDVTVERSMQDTLAAKMTLDLDCKPLFNRIQEIFLTTVNSRFDTLEEYQCRVTHISKPGHVYLCHDPKLLDSLQAFLNDDNQKSVLRNSKIKAAAELELESSRNWFYSSLVPGSQFIVTGDYELNLYRAVVLDVCMTRHVFEVELIDFGIVQRLSCIKDFWCPLPSIKLPKYINALPPLCKKYKLHGVDFALPSYVLKQLGKTEVSVKILNANRTEVVQERYCTSRIHIPSVSVRVIDDKGKVTFDLNKRLSTQANSKGYRSQ